MISIFDPDIHIYTAQISSNMLTYSSTTAIKIDSQGVQAGKRV